MKTKWRVMTALLGAAGIAQAAFVTIGNPGNAADTTDGDDKVSGIQRYGAVGYTYKISATEVTIAEFVASGAGDGDEDFWNDGTRTVGTTAPASKVSLYEAMKYCNWLTSGNINVGYYSTSDGGATYQANALNHEAYAVANGVTYFVPTEDEWYKAAYYTGNPADLWGLYANGTDSVSPNGTADGWNYYRNGYVNGSPNYTWTTGYGGEEQNGTYDMMGNVWEWTEDSGGVYRGGSFVNTEYYLRSSRRHDGTPLDEFVDVGFRVVAVPEPATIGLVAFAVGLALIFRRRFAG
jgi:formylglycine-generating enzyme required for sulfatase activity